MMGGSCLKSRKISSDKLNKDLYLSYGKRFYWKFFEVRSLDPGFTKFISGFLN